MDQFKKTKLLRKLSYLPLIIMGVFFIYFFLSFRDLSVNDILNYTPSNHFLASLIMILFFVIKSISIVIPLAVLYISSSIIFPWYWAIIINLIGLFISMTIPYYIGKFSGKTLIDRLMYRYPKVNKINKIKAKNQWIFVFTIKILGFIPNDVSSMVLGALNTDYKTFIIFSVLAKMPMMLIQTLIGINIKQPESKGFKILIAIAILILIFTLFIYGRTKKMK